jgi:predicted ATPase with chaperone activity
MQYFWFVSMFLGLINCKKEKLKVFCLYPPPLEKKNKIKDFIAPVANRQKNCYRGKSEYISCLRLLLRLLNLEPYTYNACDLGVDSVDLNYDFADVKSQKNTKWSVEITAAGDRNIIMSAPLDLVWGSHDSKTHFRHIPSGDF